jgi:transcriptional regulator with XRE-family HTH domain
MDNIPNIGRRLRRLREIKGWETNRLAQEAGLSQSYIYKLELDDRPTVAGVVLSRLATALETTTDYLVGRTADPNPPPPPGYEMEVGQAMRLLHLARRLGKLPAQRQQQFMDLAEALVELVEEAEGK